MFFDVADIFNYPLNTKKQQDQTQEWPAHGKHENSTYNYSSIYSGHARNGLTAVHNLPCPALGSRLARPGQARQKGKGLSHHLFQPFQQVCLFLA